MKAIKEVVWAIVVLCFMSLPLVFIGCTEEPEPKERTETVEVKPKRGYIALRNTTGVKCIYYLDTPCDTVEGYNYTFSTVSLPNVTQDTIWGCGSSRTIKISQVRPSGYYVNITTEYTLTPESKFLHDFTPPKL